MNKPAFEIVRIQLMGASEEWGNDLAYWDLTVRKDGSDFQLMIWFEHLWRWCKQNRPEWDTYFSSVRKNIQGFGPKHGKMFRIFNEEEFDFLPLINDYLSDTSEINWFKIQRPGYVPPDQLPDYKTLEACARDLEQCLEEVRKADIKNENFMDNTLTWLTAEILRIYPGIMNADGAHIRKLNELLVRHVMDLGRSIDSLAYRAENGIDPYSEPAIW